MLEIFNVYRFSVDYSKIFYEADIYAFLPSELEALLNKTISSSNISDNSSTSGNMTQNVSSNMAEVMMD